ncbi:MAG: J domain-containing protein [Acidobacteriota bacterium]
MEFKDYYTTLGVSKTASDADIKKAYRKLARQFHPDLNPSDKKAEARFKEINEANEVLGDPEKRRKYDELGANWRQYEQTGPAGAGGGAPPGWAGGPFGGGAGGGGQYRTMTPEEMQDAMGGDGSFSDFFQQFFGGGGGFSAGTGARAGRQARPTRGQDFEQEVDLTLEEAFTGTTRRLVSSRDGQERSVEVRIPAGVKDGARVRAAGEGGSAGHGGRAGDLYLKVHLLPHAVFERRGQDLYLKVDVPVTTTVLGGEASVPTLSGTSLRLKVPELTANGRTFRLRGHGMPSVGKPAERGDLYASVNVQVPNALSDEARKHYEALKGLEDRQG